MTSADLRHFYELFFGRRFQIQGFNVEASLDTGYKTEIVLFKDDEREVIKSNEEDLAHVILRFQKMADTDGSIRLERINNSKKYFETIREFAENREVKISNALDDLKMGNSP